MSFSLQRQLFPLLYSCRLAVVCPSFPQLLLTQVSELSLQLFRLQNRNSLKLFWPKKGEKVLLSGKYENKRWLRSLSDSVLCLLSLSVAKPSMWPSPKWLISHTKGEQIESNHIIKIKAIFLSIFYIQKVLMNRHRGFLNNKFFNSSSRMGIISLK